MKIYTNELGHMTNMATKNIKDNVLITYMKIL